MREQLAGVAHVGVLSSDRVPQGWLCRLSVYIEFCVATIVDRWCRGPAWLDFRPQEAVRTRPEWGGNTTAVWYEGLTDHGGLRTFQEADEGIT